MPYVLKVDKQLTVLRMLADGGSISSVSRLTGVHRDTCTRLMERFGRGCRSFLDREMKDLELTHLELDEIWTFCRKKDRNITGDEKDPHTLGSFFLYVALDETTRLVPAFRIGRRDQANTNAFIYDLSQRLRYPKPHDSDNHAFAKGKYEPVVRISTDGFPAYENAIDTFLGQYASYAQIVKNHNAHTPEEFVHKKLIRGQIAPEDVSTSLVERNNLTTRTFLRRFNRKTICYSKKLANLSAAVAIHFAHYNYCWSLKTLKTTPAVAAGIAQRRLKFQHLYEEVRNGWPELFVSENNIVL